MAIATTCKTLGRWIVAVPVSAPVPAHPGADEKRDGDPNGDREHSHDGRSEEFALQRVHNAVAGKGDEDRIRDAGATGYLSKPVSIGPFMAAVRGLVPG